MRFQVSAYRMVILAKQIFADVFEKVEMTNVIRYARKDFLDGIQYSNTHVVHQSNRGAIGLLDPAQKRDELAGVFRGDFDIAQYDLG